MNCKFCCDSIYDVIAFLEDEEKWIWNYIRLKKGGAFVDVGADYGKYTVTVAKIIGEDGKVIAIEPHPDNYKKLKRNIELNKLNNVVIYNIAAWSDKQVLKLYIGKSHGFHSVLKNYGFGSIPVKARSLDEVLWENDIKRGVVLIKIDVEGAELEVLKGLAKTLKEFHPKIIIEVWNDIKQVEKFMTALGYKCRKIASEYYLFDFPHED